MKREPLPTKSYHVNSGLAEVILKQACHMKREGSMLSKSLINQCGSGYTMVKEVVVIQLSCCCKTHNPRLMPDVRGGGG